VNVERGSLQGATRERLDAAPPLIEADILHVREREHANVVGLSQHI